MGGLCSKTTFPAPARVEIKPSSAISSSNNNNNNNNNNDDDEQQSVVVVSQSENNNNNKLPLPFYDGIPRYDNDSSHRSTTRSTQAALVKVSDVSSRFGRAGTLGIGKAKDVLDTLGSSITNLNPTTSFVSAKPNQLAILSFEIANTIVKASNLIISISKPNIASLNQLILLNKAVHNLVSVDTHQLLTIVAADKREELSLFSGEVIRFGNRSKDPQWHNLDRYFHKVNNGECIPQNSFKEEVEMTIKQLMTLVHNTAELYHELQILDRFEQDCQRKHHEEDNSAGSQKDNGLTILKAELKSQRRLVKILKKKSLWSRSLEEVMEKLIDIVHFIFLEIRDAFGCNDDHSSGQGSFSSRERLGPSGLSLHYANIVMQIDSLVARSSSVPMTTRNTLYQSLPPSIKTALRSKLQSFRLKEELTVTQIKAEMEKTLHWLVPIASNTAKAHHGFGWVGEWANTGSENNRKSASGPMDVIRIETLHHADKEKTDAYILEQVLWLHYLVSRSLNAGEQINGKSRMKQPSCATSQKPKPNHESSLTASITSEDKLLLQDMSRKRRAPGVSRSVDFDFEKTRLRKEDKLSKSSSHSTAKVTKGAVSIKRQPSGVPLLSFEMEKQKAMDIIDRLDALVR
ncbi:hypothetical protein ACFE04_018469 [Oxalis oulophora]